MDDYLREHEISDGDTARSDDSTTSVKSTNSSLSSNENN